MPAAIAAALLGMIVIACAVVVVLRLAHLPHPGQAGGSDRRGRAALARDLYSYLHLPMVAGIVLFAFGLKTTIADVDGPLSTIPAVGLCGGLALYFLAHVAGRLRLGGGLGRGRPVATLVLVGLASGRDCRCPRSSHWRSSRAVCRASFFTRPCAIGTSAPGSATDGAPSPCKRPGRSPETAVGLSPMKSSDTLTGP